MLGKKAFRQDTLLIPGTIRNFIPDDHILVKVDNILDLSWLESEVVDVYCADNGRPSIAPETAMRLMLAGFFLSIVHDRKLIREAQVNLAIRWFVGFDLSDDIPNHSSLTRIRQRWGEALFKTLFDRIVKQCIDAGLVTGDTIHFDATLIRADVSWNSLVTCHAQRVIDENEACDDDDDPDHPKKRKRGRPKTQKKFPKKVSTTDPDATMATNCRNQRLEPTFKQHTAVDDECGIIVDVAITTGEASEGRHLPETIKRVESRTGKTPNTVTADSGCAHSANYQYLEEIGCDAVIPPARLARRKNGKIPAYRFKYDQKHDLVRCPRGKKLFKGSSRRPNGCYYRAKAKVCKACPMRAQCLSSTQSARTIFIVDGHASYLRARRKKCKGWSREWKFQYNRHRYQVEGIHGESKSCHGLRRAHRRGLPNVSIQAYLTAVAINLKRLVKYIHTSPDGALDGFRFSKSINMPSDYYLNTKSEAVTVKKVIDGYFNKPSRLLLAG